MWLGPAPEAPYHQDRCLYRFRFIYDYSGGQITNYGAHSNDLAQWAMDADATGPVEVDICPREMATEGQPVQRRPGNRIPLPVCDRSGIDLPD